MKTIVPAGATRQTIEAVVYNADGTVKRKLGVVNYWHRNPLMRLAWRLGRHWGWSRRLILGSSPA